MPRSAEHGRTGRHQIYEAACAAMPNQGSRKEHLLLADIKKAMKNLPDVDTSDSAVQSVFEMLVANNNIVHEAAKGTYTIVDRSPRADADTVTDTDIDDSVLVEQVDMTTGGASLDAARGASVDTVITNQPDAGASAPATGDATPVQHHTAAYSERKFARWKNYVQQVHQDILRIVSNLDVGELDTLKKNFKELTGEEWNESFAIHQFLAEKKSARTELKETEADTKEVQYASAVVAYEDKLIELFEQLGVPAPSNEYSEFNELCSYLHRTGEASRVTIKEFVAELRGELITKNGDDVVKAERALYFLLAKMTDTTLAYHMNREFNTDPQEPESLVQAREAFLRAQEDYNDFEKKILRNPFTSGKKRKVLVETLEAAREAYNVESAEMIAGRSHRFLNEYNKQIDKEIEIRDERRAARGGDGKLSKLKDTFYGMYKWLGDQSLDKAYQTQKGEEPTKGTWIRKAVNLRTAIGFGLGMVGLRSGWRAAMGAGAGIGMYEGLKAKITATIQSEAHRLLDESNPANMDDSEIYDVMQQIRMRAALDGKSVVDTNFPLHKSFAALRELLHARQEALPTETREQAFANADRISAALDTINGQLEEDMTKQADSRRKQVLAGLAVGGATVVVAPWILDKLGVGAEKIADWWVGDPALSDTLEPGSSPTIPEVVPTPPVELPGDGLRAVVERGEGAYHAVYKLMDQLSPADKAEFVDTIAERHPNWVERDASGQITNADRILRNWRMEAVNSTQLDSGGSVSVYNPATREYGVMLHPNAQFSLEYDENGYPQLHLHGDEATGRYRILDEGRVRHVAPDGDVSFVPPSDVPTVEPEEPSTSSRPTAESVLASAEDIGASVDALAEEAITTLSEVGDATTVDMVSPEDIRRDVRSIPQGVGETVFGDDRLPVEETTRVIEEEVTRTESAVPSQGEAATTDTAPTISEEATEVVSESIRRIEGANGRYIEFSYDDDGALHSRIAANMSHITNGMLREPIHDVNELYVRSDGALLENLGRTRVDSALRQMYAYDEAMNIMREQGNEDTPEFRLLERLYRNGMEQVAHIKNQTVQDVFATDVLREHGFEVPDSDLSETTSIPEVGDVTMPTVDRAILE